MYTKSSFEKSTPSITNETPIYSKITFHPITKLRKPRESYTYHSMKELQGKNPNKPNALYVERTDDTKKPIKYKMWYNGVLHQGAMNPQQVCGIDNNNIDTFKKIFPTIIQKIQAENNKYKNTKQINIFNPQFNIQNSTYQIENIQNNERNNISTNNISLSEDNFINKENNSNNQTNLNISTNNKDLEDLELDDLEIDDLLNFNSNKSNTSYENENSIDDNSTKVKKVTNNKNRKYKFHLMSDLNDGDPTEIDNIYLQKADAKNVITFKMKDDKNKIHHLEFKVRYDWEKLDNNNLESFKIIHKNICNQISKNIYNKSDNTKDLLITSNEPFNNANNQLTTLFNTQDNKINFSQSFFKNHDKNNNNDDFLNFNESIFDKNIEETDTNLNWNP
jgi:hypothetical protein